MDGKYDSNALFIFSSVMLNTFPMHTAARIFGKLYPPTKWVSIFSIDSLFLSRHQPIRRDSRARSQAFYSRTGLRHRSCHSLCGDARPSLVCSESCGYLGTVSSRRVCPGPLRILIIPLLHLAAAKDRVSKASRIDWDLISPSCSLPYSDEQFDVVIMHTLLSAVPPSV